jgi:protein gp37
MINSKIEWTENTWNPTTGCTKISAGCANCYAEIMTRRLKAMGIKKYENGFKFTCHESELNTPYTWKKPRRIFVNSMSDLFHEDAPFDFIKAVFDVMNNCPQHIFQILTKRAHILYAYSPFLKWTPNIWMGVTIEDANQINRIDSLNKVPAAIKFLSLEPLLTPLHELDLICIDWAIVGGESGPKARKIEKDWIIEIQEQCAKEKVPFFFKQWGGRNKKASGKLIDGKLYQAMPNKLFKPNTI